MALLIDDLLLMPFKGVLWLARELEKAAHTEVANEAQAITDRLGELYMLLETGEITEEEFDLQEEELLDRLDALAGEEDDA
ncbi:MAG: gas vesicle protein GvpG [Myxococcota bacterium]